jgi:hypothetical protein
MEALLAGVQHGYMCMRTRRRRDDRVAQNFQLLGAKSWLAEMLNTLSHSQRTCVVVTPVFPKKTKCKTICMRGSIFIRIVT